MAIWMEVCTWRDHLEPPRKTHNQGMEAGLRTVWEQVCATGLVIVSWPWHCLLTHSHWRLPDGWVFIHNPHGLADEGHWLTMPAPFATSTYLLFHPEDCHPSCVLQPAPTGLQESIVKFSENLQAKHSHYEKLN